MKSGNGHIQPRKSNGKYRRRKPEDSCKGSHLETAVIIVARLKKHTVGHREKQHSRRIINDQYNASFQQPAGSFVRTLRMLKLRKRRPWIFLHELLHHPSVKNTIQADFFYFLSDFIEKLRLHQVFHVTDGNISFGAFSHFCVLHFQPWIPDAAADQRRVGAEILCEAVLRPPHDHFLLRLSHTPAGKILGGQRHRLLAAFHQQKRIARQNVRQGILICLHTLPVHRFQHMIFHKRQQIIPALQDCLLQRADHKILQSLRIGQPVHIDGHRPCFTIAGVKHIFYHVSAVLQRFFQECIIQIKIVLHPPFYFLISSVYRIHNFSFSGNINIVKQHFPVVSGDNEKIYL